MEYTLKFEMPYINCDNYKEKDLINLIGVITGTRINDLIDHYTYGNIKFSDGDRQHIYPIVTELDNFMRSKTNCIIFDVNPKYQKKYKKLFVYQSLNRENPYYGIVGLKEENDKPVHIYFINLDYSILVINMHRMIQNNIIK
jgi:hypothetical protein